MRVLRWFVRFRYSLRTRPVTVFEPRLEARLRVEVHATDLYTGRTGEALAMTQSVQAHARLVGVLTEQANGNFTGRQRTLQFIQANCFHDCTFETATPDAGGGLCPWCL